MWKYSSKIVKRLACLILVFAPLCVVAQQYSFGANWAHTTAGDLLISIEAPHRVAVTLNGKVLLNDDEDHYSWLVVSAFPSTGLARLVLLESDNGNNYCPAYHRVLEIKPDGQLSLTGDFGDCEKHDAIKLSSEAKIVALNNPKYINGEWRIGLDWLNKSTKRWSRVWYVYKDGRVTLHGRVVASSQ